MIVTQRQQRQHKCKHKIVLLYRQFYNSERTLFLAKKCLIDVNSRDA